MFRQARQVAATQADVIAHSMGGTIVRTLSYLPKYADSSSFGVGSVHKLITIGMPHLGTPLAGLLLQDVCVRTGFATQNRFAISKATVSGASTTGAVGDLQGSGQGTTDGSLSQALGGPSGTGGIQAPNGHPVPTLPIAGAMNASLTPPSNTSGLLNCQSCLASTIRLCPGTLAANLSPTGWPNVFGNNSSDAIVPVNSQVNGNSNEPQVPGLIHSSALELIGFSGPTVLDPATIQTFVIGALNLSVQMRGFLCAASVEGMMSRIKSRLTQIVRLLASSYALTGFLAAQPSLRITSPADGTTVHPGESVTVTVDVSPPEGAFQTVVAVGYDPIGRSKEALKEPPYRFTIQIPTSITPRGYDLTAMGFTLPGQSVPPNPILSHPITIFVERADSPISISVYPPMALEIEMDEKGYLQVTGLFADKTTVFLTHSSRISYVSSAPGVAKVDAQGIVSPVAPGTAKIIITYGDLKTEVPLKVREGQR